MSERDKRQFSRERISPAIRVEIGNLACVICGTENDTCIDHIIPVAKGGKSVRENLQPLCQVCNSIKDINKTNDHIKALIKARPAYFAERQKRRALLKRKRWPSWTPKGPYAPKIS